MKRRSLLAFALLAGNLSGSELLSLKPTLLHPDTGPSLVPALRITSTKRSEWAARADRIGFLEYDLASTLTGRAEANDEKTALDLRIGIEWTLDKVAPPMQVFPGPGASTPPPVISPPAAGQWRWGTLSTELAAAFEGDEAMENRQWVYGLRLNYTPAFDRTPSQWWVPYLWLDYRRVSEIGSGVQARAGLPGQDYWRFGSQLFWQFALVDAGASGFWRNVKLVPGLQYYRSTDQALQIGDHADAYHYSAALDWAVPNTHRWGKWLSGVRLQVADGRIPPSLMNRTTVSLALTVRWDQLLR